MSPTESLTRRGVPHLQMGHGCVTTGTAADSEKVTPLLTIQGQCGIVNRASDHMMVIVTARIW